MSLGEHIRKLRNEKKMKIIDLAEKTQLSSSMISQVERDLIFPSIDSLKKIGDALETPISVLFERINTPNAAAETDSDSPKPVSTYSKELFEVSPVVHENQRKLLSPSKGIELYLLNPDMTGPTQFIYSVYEPGSDDGPFHTHAGTECGLVIEGELEVQLEDKVYFLKKGDSITFSSERPHRMRNFLDHRCVSIWANSPPWF